MDHRNLNSTYESNGELSLTAIEDIIERGERNDWWGLGQELRHRPEKVAPKIQRIVSHRLSQEYQSQSFIVWDNHLKRHYAEFI